MWVIGGTHAELQTVYLFTHKYMHKFSQGVCDGFTRRGGKELAVYSF